MITRTLPGELMEDIRTLEEAYPVTVGVHELPFTECDWTTAKVLVVLSFSFSEHAQAACDAICLQLS